MTLGELHTRMSAAEMSAWKTFSTVYPIGEERADVRHAHWMSLWANAHRNPKTNPRPFVLDDFMLFKIEAKESGTNAASLRAYLQHLYSKQKKVA